MSLYKPMNVNLTLRYEENQMEIKHKITGEVLLTVECTNLRGANLEGANLRWVDLRFADLRGANLNFVDLSFADLRGADLRGANLQVANLQMASLKGANLEGANLRFANLRNAKLQGADLRGANLREADLKCTKLPTNVTRINGMKWDVTIFQDWMTIGCQHHHIDDWNKFTDDEIAEMDDGALEFWKENKDKLITVANLTK